MWNILQTQKSSEKYEYSPISCSFDMHKASRQIFFSISHSRSKKVSWRSGGGLVVSSRNKFILSIVRRYNRMWEAKSSTRFVARYGTGSTSLALKIRTTNFEVSDQFWSNCEEYSSLLFWECSDYTLNRKAKMCLKRATVIYLSIPRVNKITKSVIQDLKNKTSKMSRRKKIVRFLKTQVKIENTYFMKNVINNTRPCHSLVRNTDRTALTNAIN